MLRALAVIWLIWGLNWVVMKTANSFFPPILFVTWRFGTGALILLAVAYWKKIPLPDKKFVPWIFLTGLLMIVLNNIAAQVGMKTISAGMAAVLNYTAPLWTAILAHFTLNERLTRLKCFGIFLAIVGLYVLMGLQGVDDLGEAFIIIAGAIVLVLYTSLVPQGEIHWCLTAVLCVIYNGALASALAFFLWNYVLTHIEASTASIATLVAPVVGVLGGVVILGEPFTAYIVVGMALIFTGILIVVKKGAKKL